MGRGLGIVKFEHPGEGKCGASLQTMHVAICQGEFSMVCSHSWRCTDRTGWYSLERARGILAKDKLILFRSYMIVDKGIEVCFCHDHRSGFRMELRRIDLQLHNQVPVRRKVRHNQALAARRKVLLHFLVRNQAQLRNTDLALYLYPFLLRVHDPGHVRQASLKASMVAQCPTDRQ